MSDPNSLTSTVLKYFLERKKNGKNACMLTPEDLVNFANVLGNQLKPVELTVIQEAMFSECFQRKCEVQSELLNELVSRHKLLTEQLSEYKKCNEGLEASLRFNVLMKHRLSEELNSFKSEVESVRHANRIYKSALQSVRKSSSKMLTELENGSSMLIDNLSG